MEFCPKCEGMLRKRKLDDGTYVLVCRCGYERPLAAKAAAESEVPVNLEDLSPAKRKALAREATVIESEEVTHPTTSVECPKCKHDEAEWWELQTRSADEPATVFYRCTKCRFTWREY